jgi:hypothetical protein
MDASRLSYKNDDDDDDGFYLALDLYWSFCTL